MGSEAGVLDIAPEDVVKKGRLEPGKMFLVDLERGPDRRGRRAEARHRRGQALRRVAPPSTCPRSLDVARRRRTVPAPDPDTLLHRQQAFGYTLEDLKYILMPMGNAGEEADRLDGV